MLMTRVETLREQARVLRSLAGSFDDEAIRSDLLSLAQRCEETAARIADSIRQAMSRPIDDPRQSKALPKETPSRISTIPEGGSISGRADRVDAAVPTTKPDQTE
jgi:hypothetical protein